MRIKDHHAEQRLFERRAIAAAVIMALALGLVIVRLVWLQVVRYEYFAGESQGNQIRIEPIPPNRGLIFDRNGLPLATNAPSYQLELIREQVEDLDATLTGLAALDLIDESDVPAIKKDIRSRRVFEAVPIKLQLTEEELARFAARRHQFPGVEIRPRLTRYYPLGATGVHAIGYVGAISEEDQKRLDPKEYAGTTLTGKTGVERAYEHELHGRSGVQQLLVNAQGRQVERIGNEPVKLERIEPVAGNDLFLTLDQRVQQAAEEALRGQRASAVAIDPNNGDVIAFVSTPAFDPNLFARGLSRREYLALTEDPDRPMFDRALRGVYPPGSTVKPLFALAALETGVVTPNETRFCRGVWSAPGYGRARRDWKPGGHGAVNMRKAIATSCDVYFFDIARLMGIDRMAGFLEQFGIGQPTGIDIPGERAGILPSTEWKKRAFKQKEYQVWFPGDTISVGIGQGQMLMTPLQLAHAVATVAARGKRYKPRLVRAIRDVTTGEIRELPPSPLPPAKTSDPAAWEVAIGGMFDVLNAPYGTARYYVNSSPPAPYTMAGKSGTAQVFTVSINERMRKADELAEHLRDHALFVAFAPVEAPKIAVAVVVENAPGGGSAYAGPIARRILDTYLLTPEQLAEQDAKRKPARAPAAPTDTE
ncbi:MAG TPA: penicillin-binding protein 2 [Steroidobacteraceae bacterium]